MVSNIDFCTCQSAYLTGKCDCNESGKDHQEIIVKLADGCTVKSGAQDKIAGYYIQIFNPDDKEIAYWHHSDWEKEPILTMKAILNFMAGKRISKIVDLIASGYEWTCPNCGEPNTEIEIGNRLECLKCGYKCCIGEVHHAHS